jgi:hypothetical protein
LYQTTVILGPWVAMDIALDRGYLDVAAELGKTWQDDESSPARQFRMARMLRYEGNGADAVKLVDSALRSGSATQRLLIEATLCLIAVDNHKSAQELVSRYQERLGVTAGWLKVLLDATSTNPKRAKAQAALLEPPPPGSPVVVQMLAAKALAFAGDKRAKAVVAPLLRRYALNPDVADAAKAVGLMR